MIRHLLRRNWEALLLIVVGTCLLLSLQVIAQTTERHSHYALVRGFIAISNSFHDHIVPVTTPLYWLVLVVYVLCPLPSRVRRLMVDVVAAWFSFRVLESFVFINLLMFAKAGDHGLLIAQLLVFLPCLLLMWGWIYWRLDSGYCRRTGARMFAFKLPSGALPTVYDYFLVSFSSLISHSLSSFSGNTRLARTLIFAHGLMIWDVMGLTLSRAIALVSSSTV